MLKPKQKQMAELMVLEPSLTNREYAKRISVDEKTLYKWKKIPEFQDYIHELCQQHFKSMERLAMKKLKEQVENDNWKAIEYLLNGNGYRAKEEIDVSSSDININIGGLTND